MEKYIVYKNDLKYKKDRNLDKRHIIWDKQGLQDLYENANLDTLDFRFHDCRNNGKSYLDLSNMDLITFPKIPMDLVRNIRYLFISENEIENLPNMHLFENLEVLDISFNSIYELGDKLPKTLVELVCNNNKISVLPECLNLVRLDCSSNDISEIPRYEKLTKLICNNNKLSVIPNFPKLLHLSCCNNNINFIEGCERVTYLDCSANKLIELPNYSFIVDLICTGNNISEIVPYQTVKYIEIFATGIQKLPYMPKLEELYCNKDMVNKISKMFVENKLLDIQVHKETMLHISFTDIKK